MYIHESICISPQETSSPLKTDGINGKIPVTEIKKKRRNEAMKKLGTLRQPVDNIFKITELSLEGVHANALRRMSKSVRLGLGCALPLLSRGARPDGILVGTGNGGMEDSVKFLKEIITYNEEMLTPGPFVQSTPNSIAAQIGLQSRNKGYNITYVHRGLAFESALLDASMLLRENPANNYLVGGVDEFSPYNHHLELADGWYKQENVPGHGLYDSGTPGSIAGEGAVMFITNNVKEDSMAVLKGVATLHSQEEPVVMDHLSGFIKRYLPAEEKIDLLLTGENGDSRALKWYTACEAMIGPDAGVARFKHMCGEYPTASAFALWLACHLSDAASLPPHLLKRKPADSGVIRNILIYNNHKSSQHSFMLVERFL